MNIGIDLAEGGAASGNARYTKSLVDALRALSAQNQYRALRPWHRFGPLNDALLRLRARMAGVDVFHFTNPLNFVNGPYASVATLHDLAPLHDPSWSKRSSRDTFDAKVGDMLAHTRLFIAVSEYTKRDIMERLGVAEERIRVVYEAADPFFFPAPDASVLARFGAGRYVLCAGQLQPRKNVLALIEAFALVHARVPDLQLILVGRARDATYRKAVKEAIHRSELDGQIILAGAVDDATLRALYSGAECFAYPSLFEGFGLPVLEALACGTPVVTSSTSSLPEVAGEAGLLVDPRDPAAIGAAIEHLSTDAALRARLKERAIPQARKFSWEKAARETLSVYVEALSQSRA